MAATTTCPTCHQPATGKFCSNCGAPLAGATCAECGAALTPGAKFCHRCGTPAGASAGADVADRGFAAALPWAVAAIALVALIALVAGQRFAHRTSSNAPVAAADQAGATDQAAPMAGNGPAPDISNMSPAERASRLYDRIMSWSERGKTDSVQIFAPMAVAAYEMLGTLTLDERYDLGRIGAASGDLSLAKAEADTILKQSPTHLLGLVLAAQVAKQSKNDAATRDYLKRLAAAAPAERARQLPEYAQHKNDIDAALAEAGK